MSIGGGGGRNVLPAAPAPPTAAPSPLRTRRTRAAQQPCDDKNNDRDVNVKPASRSAVTADRWYPRAAPNGPITARPSPASIDYPVFAIRLPWVAKRHPFEAGVWLIRRGWGGHLERVRPRSRPRLSSHAGRRAGRPNRTR